MKLSKRGTVAGGLTLCGVVVLAAVWGTLGCGPSTDTKGNGKKPATETGAKPTVNEPVSDLTGKIKIDGSSTVYLVSMKAAESFRKKFPKIDVTLGFVGTGGGFKLFSKGELDISDASRPITAEELAECEKNGVKFIELPVAYDGLTVAVNPKNDWAEQFTVDDLKKIYLKGGAAKWNELNPEWPDLPIKVFAPGTDSGTFDYFREVLGGKKVEFRDGISQSEDDNVLVTGVSGQKDAIGYFGAAYYFANKDKLKAVKIVNPEGKAVAPAHDAIESGEYAPLSRPLFIYVSESALKRRDAQRFVAHYLEHAAEIAEQAGYVALPKDVYERARQNLKERRLGTHYLSDSGEKREGPVTTVYEAANLRAMK